MLVTAMDSPRPRYEGIVKFYCPAKGWGFIERKGKPDIFIHKQNLDKHGIDKLTPGQRISFREKVQNGKMRAVHIELL